MSKKSLNVAWGTPTKKIESPVKFTFNPDTIIKPTCTQDDVDALDKALTVDAVDVVDAVGADWITGTPTVKMKGILEDWLTENDLLQKNECDKTFMKDLKKL